MGGLDNSFRGTNDAGYSSRLGRTWCGLADSHAFRYHATCTGADGEEVTGRGRIYERLSTESMDDGPGSEMDGTYLPSRLGSPDSDG